VTSENVRLLKYNITQTHSVFQSSQLLRKDAQKFQSKNSDLVPILMLNTGTKSIKYTVKVTVFENLFSQ